MITGALTTAEARMRDIRRFLALSERKSVAIKHILDSAIPSMAATPSQEWASEVSSFTPGRTYDYACSIIFLYGLIERFMEDLVDEYLDALVSRIRNFDALPEKLRNSQFDLTIAQLQRSRDSRYSGKNNAARLAESLSACLSGRYPIDFVNEPLLHHTSNFRVPIIDDFLNRIGISHASRRAAGTQAFADYSKAGEVGKVIPQDHPETVWELTNDLVERRNQVTHGDVTDVLAPSELYPYCDHVEAYYRGLARIVRDTLAEMLAPGIGVAHDQPIKVYNRNIVCIYSKGVELRPGTVLACRVNDGSWYSLMVEEVQINRNTVASAPRNQDVAVGLRTDGRCKEGHAIFSIV